MDPLLIFLFTHSNQNRFFKTIMFPKHQASKTIIFPKPQASKPLISTKQTTNVYLVLQQSEVIILL